MNEDTLNLLFKGLEHVRATLDSLITSGRMMTARIIVLEDRVEDLERQLEATKGTLA